MGGVGILVEEIRNRSDESPSIFSLFEKVSKYPLYFVGLSYIFGFIIVNSYLASFGLVNISVIKAKYIAAGAVFLVFCTLCGMFLYPLALSIPPLKEKRSFTIDHLYWLVLYLLITQWLLSYIAPDALSYSWVNNFWHDKFSFRLFSTYLVILMFISFLCFIIFPFIKRLSKFFKHSYCVAMGISSYLQYTPGVLWVMLWVLFVLYFAPKFISDFIDVVSRKKHVADMSMSALFIIYLTLGLCQFYAVGLYPKIENKYGGGKPVQINLFLGDEVRPLSSLLFEDNLETSRVIKDVTLLDEDGDYFFIQKKGTPQDKTIRIKKSLINAIVHIKK